MYILTYIIALERIKHTWALPHTYTRAVINTHMYVCLFVCMYVCTSVACVCMCEDLWGCKYLHVCKILCDEPHDTVDAKGTYIHAYIHTIIPFRLYISLLDGYLLKSSFASIASGSFFLHIIILNSSQTRRSG